MKKQHVNAKTKIKNSFFLIKVILLCLMLAQNAWASSRGCSNANEAKVFAPETLARTSQLVQAAQNMLSDQKVALIARAGMNLQRYVEETERDSQKLDYTHLGIAWRDSSQQWHILHLLNKCEAEQSSLFESGLGAFFMDSLLPQFVIAIPDEQTQTQLLAMVQSNLPQKVHQVRYNLVSAPNDPDSQNCTQWALEVLALHFVPPATEQNLENWRIYAQTVLKNLDYQAPEFAIPFWLKTVSRAYAGSVVNFSKQSKPVRITTAWAVLQFLRQHAPATRIEEYRLK